MRIPYEQLMGDAPDDAIIVPGKRKPDKGAEWRLQARCVKHLRKLMAADKDLWFIAPMAETPRDTTRAAVAKMMGLQKGVPDLWIIRRAPFRLRIVELKRLGGKLSPEQSERFAWLNDGGVDCYRCDDFEKFKGLCVF